MSDGEIWVLCRLAGFARLPGGFEARGGSAGNRCEDAYAFRMPQARSIKPDQEALLRQGGTASKSSTTPKLKSNAAHPRFSRASR